MAHYAIGDIQGCYDELQALLNLINFDPKQDKLWFTGDLVNRGPKSLEVLRYIKTLNHTAVTVLGNHDLHFLAVYTQQCHLQETDTFTDVLQASDCDELAQWLRHQPVFHYDAKLKYALCHAGIAPQWDLKTTQQCADEIENILQADNYSDFFQYMYGNQPDCWHTELKSWERLRYITNCFTRMRYCDQGGRLELTIKEPTSKHENSDYIPWFKVAARPTKHLNIVIGHWAALQGISNDPYVHAIDTGCCWGKELTAMRLEDQKRFATQSLQ